MLERNSRAKKYGASQNTYRLGTVAFHLFCQIRNHYTAISFNSIKKTSAAAMINDSMRKDILFRAWLASVYFPCCVSGCKNETKEATLISYSCSREKSSSQSRHRQRRSANGGERRYHYFCKPSAKLSVCKPLSKNRGKATAKVNKPTTNPVAVPKRLLF